MSIDLKKIRLQNRRTLKKIGRFEAEFEVEICYQRVLRSIILCKDRSEIENLTTAALKRIGELCNILNEDFVIDVGARLEYYHNNINESIEAVEYMKEIHPQPYCNMVEETN